MAKSYLPYSRFWKWDDINQRMFIEENEDYKCYDYQQSSWKLVYLQTQEKPRHEAVPISIMTV